MKDLGKVPGSETEMRSRSKSVIFEGLLYPYKGKIDAIYIDPPYNMASNCSQPRNQLPTALGRFHHHWLCVQPRSDWTRVKERTRLDCDGAVDDDNLGPAPH
jgi:hypothetical protein